jgi:hypothetical protein
MIPVRGSSTRSRSTLVALPLRLLSEGIDSSDSPAATNRIQGLCGDGRQYGRSAFARTAAGRLGSIQHRRKMDSLPFAGPAPFDKLCRVAKRKYASSWRTPPHRAKQIRGLGLA